MLNDEQRDYERYINSIPLEQRSPCRWYLREECDRRPCCGGCASERSKAGLPPHPPKS